MSQQLGVTVGALDVGEVEQAFVAELFDAAAPSALPADQAAVLDTSAVEASRVSGHDKLMGQWVQQLAAIRNDAAKSNEYWASLSQNNGISMKTLLAFLYRDMIQGPSGRAVVAATLYLAMLPMADSEAFGLFNNIVLDACLRKLRDGVADVLLESDIVDDDDETAAPTATASQADLFDEDGDNDGLDEDNDDGEAMDAASPLVGAEVNSTYAQMVGVALQEFVAFLGKAQLQHQSDLVDRLVDVCVTLVQGARNFAPAAIPAAILPVLSQMENVMQCLLSLRFGAPGDNLGKIYKGLLPVLLMVSKKKANGSIPRPYVTAHENAKTLVFQLIQQAAKEDTVVPEGKVLTATQDKTLVLMQHLCMRVPERAEYRTLAAKAVVGIYSHSIGKLRHAFLEWLQKLGRNAKVACRVFTLDVAAELLPFLKPSTTSEEEDDDEMDVDGAHSAASGQVDEATTQQLIALLVSRVHDKMPTVRARAISVLADLLGTGVHAFATALATSIITDGWLTRRCRDDKSVVRRAAVQLVQVLLEKTTVESGYDPTPLVGLLEERCRDPVMTLRKVACVALTDVLFKYSANDGLWATWIRSVFVLIVDRETAVQEEAVSQTLRVLLHPWTAQTGAANTLCEHGIAALATMEPALLRNFQRIVVAWGKRGNELKKDVVNKMIAFAKAHPLHKGIWLLLCEVFASVPTLGDPAVPLQTWHDHSAIDGHEDLMALVVRALGVVSGKLTNDSASGLINEFRERLCSFTVAIPLISAMVECTTQFGGGDKTALTGWCTSILDVCGKLLDSPKDATHLDDDTVSRCLFIVGELYQMNPGMVSHKMLTMIQGVIASPTDASSTSPYSAALRAQGFITIGKICLLNEEFAKKYVSALARELAVCKDAVVRNNVMLVLCDLCIRYASLVDKYVPTIALCLHDSNELVRRQTLTMLTRLLQEDYIKWKGSLFFRFVSAVVDESDEIREFAKFCLVQLLLNKNPSIFYAHFQELVFFLNAYTPARSAEGYSQQQQQQQQQQSDVTEDRVFKVLAGGGHNEQKRHAIYSFLAANLTDELRFQLIGKLCSETLSNVIDGTVDVSLPGAAFAVSDVLYVLASKELKLQSKKSAQEEGDDDLTSTEKALDAAKTKLLSKLTKKNTIENILPILVSLKRHLESLHSPLLRQLMLALRTIVKEYRLEMEDLLASDRQMANEIEFDIRQFDKNEHVQQGIAATAAPMAAPSPRKSFGGVNNTPSPSHHHTPAAAATLSPMMSPAKTMSPITPALDKSHALLRGRSWNIASPIRPEKGSTIKRSHDQSALSLGGELDENDQSDLAGQEDENDEADELVVRGKRSRKSRT